MNAHETIVEVIGEGKTVLDVGAGRGDLAKLLVGNGCNVTVIESNKGLAIAAMAVASRTIIEDVETASFDFEEKFDVILFADVLEHLLNPRAVLKKFRPFLADDGVIVVSVPNIANWRTRLNLLLGRFDYTSQGILDRTHLHFYTRATAKRLVESAGYTVTKTRHVPSFPFPYFKECLSKISPRLFSFQFVFVAEKKGGEVSL